MVPPCCEPPGRRRTENCIHDHHVAGHPDAVLGYALAGIGVPAGRRQKMFHTFYFLRDSFLEEERVSVRNRRQTLYRRLNQKFDEGLYRDSSLCLRERLPCFVCGKTEESIHVKLNCNQRTLLNSQILEPVKSILYWSSINWME